MDESVKRLLGLRDFPRKTPEEKRRILKSSMRVKALDAITTTTLPISKREIKKGVVLEIAEKGLFTEELLKRNPTVYLGAGTDVEYPLALGARNITLVDPILEDEKVQQEVIERVRNLIGVEPTINGETLRFKFDFGEGEEEVEVELIARPYLGASAQENNYKLVQDIGVVLLFASQGPSGHIRADDSMKEKLVKGGVIIDGHRLNPKEGKVIELGS
jgi:hypothetical protein